MSNIIPTQRTSLLAVDLGGTTGWARWDDGMVTSGSLPLAKKSGRRFEGPGMKFVRFSRWLKGQPETNVIAFEEVHRHRGTAAAHAYGGYLAHLTAFCEAHDPCIPYEGVGVGDIKKRATGNGAASKEMMIEAACAKLGVILEDDNEADALWLLVLMVEAEGLEWPGGPVENSPVEAKKTKKGRRRKKQ